MLETILLGRIGSGSSPSTLDPSRKSSNCTLSNGNLTATFGGAGSTAFGATGKSSGKWYYEVKATKFPEPNIAIAIGLGSSTTTTSSPFATATQEFFWYTNSVGTSMYVYGAGLTAGVGGTFVEDDIIGLALDYTALQFQFYRNGTGMGWSPLTTYSSNTELWPCFAQPSVSSVNVGVIDWQSNPKYCPAGYSLW